MSDFIETSVMVENIGPNGIGFRQDSVDYFCIKQGDELFVYQNKCPHFGVRLEFLPNEFLDANQSAILCSRHSALFDIRTGHCHQGPCLNESLTAVQHIQKQGRLYIQPL